MLFFNFLSKIIGGILTPAALFISSAFVSPIVRILKIISPRQFFRTLCDLPSGKKSSPLRALSVALAGTLGVGNITGVASALISGGPGAIFWMWVGAIVVLSVKYAEVHLAIQFRRKNDQGFFGGAMYYIRDGLSAKTGAKNATIFGGFFAVICCANSLITGNIVQSNAAACIFGEDFRLYCGIALATLVLFSIIYGVQKVETITVSLIPLLTGVYMLIAVWIIGVNISIIPSILADIVSSALTGRAIFGAAVGFSVREAMRFGIMRGIFSNEAGCGTSPIAHASANTKSPHHQACYGIVEVVFDTLILCTMTALVLLIADQKFAIIPWRSSADASPVTMSAFRLLGGNIIYYILCSSVVLFAFATVIAQIYYGTISIRYFTNKKTPQVIYSVLSVSCTVVGSVISAPVMWTIADIIIGIMTAVNCGVIILLSSRLRSQRLTFDPR